MNINPEFDAVEALLVEYWYPYLRSFRPNLGAGQSSPMFRDSRNAAGNVYLDESDGADAADHIIFKIIAQSVDACVDALPTWQMRVAVELRAANRCGAAVWRSGRLTPEELLIAWQDARVLLLDAFMQRDLIKKIAKAIPTIHNSHVGQSCL